MFLFEKLIAHRGLHDEKCPENSMSAFKRALENGYNIETDVHLLKTGEVVVFHDNNLKRICGKNVKIADLTLDDIKSDRYLLPNGEHIPLFSEMLDFVNGQTGILLELKFATFFDNKLEQAVYKLIKGKESWIAVQSFSPLIMAWFHRHAPEFYLGVLCSRSLQPLLSLYRTKINPDFLAYEINDAAFAKKYADKYNYTLLVWTINTHEKVLAAKSTGVNNIIFETVSPATENYSLEDNIPAK